MEEKKKKEAFKQKLFLTKENRITGVSPLGAICLCVLSVLLGFLFFSLVKKRPVTLSPDNIGDKFVYKTTIVQHINPDDEATFAGKVSFDENNVIKIFPMVTGKVEDVRVTLGNYVKKGDALARIKSSDVSDFLKEYNVARANYQIAKKNLNVAESLYKSKFNSELDVLTARKEMQKAEMELKKAGDVLKVYGANPEEHNPYLMIKSPIEGYVVEKNINSNMLINPDNITNLFTISDLKTVWIYANVFEDDIARVREGQQVSVFTQAYPGKVFRGKIDNVSSILSASSRTLRLRVVLNNDSMLLRPEMAAQVKVKIPYREKLLAIPPQALVFDKDTYYVLQVTGRKHFHARPVELVEKAPRVTYIRKGVNAGDTIVTEGSLLLYNQIANRL